MAIISPSAGLPEVFPWVQDLGLKRLREQFGLVAKEYPTTRKMRSSPQDRARDITDAFSDKENKAVFASIGGTDQIKVIKYLDPQVFIDNPKPFFGYSDNTHLHNFLWNLGIPSYYGGCIMTQFAMNVRMFDMTVSSLRNALFETGFYDLEVADQYNDIGIDWSDRENLNKSRQLEKNDGLYWDGEESAEGILWGGCVESLIAQVSANIYMPNDTDMDGVILAIETAEDIPEHWITEYLLTGLGERGWLNRLKAILVGRPKAWEFDKQNTAEEKIAYREKQRTTVLEVIRQYNEKIPVIQNIDFGHTDPQVILPFGQTAVIDSQARKISLKY